MINTKTKTDTKIRISDNVGIHFACTILCYFTWMACGALMQRILCVKIYYIYYSSCHIATVPNVDLCHSISKNICLNARSIFVIVKF